MIRAVIFDFDDTLVRTFEVKAKHHQAVARQCYNIDLSLDEIKKHWGKPFPDLVSILYQDKEPIEVMIEKNRAVEADFPKEAQPGAIDAVRMLRAADLPVGIVTSTSTSFVKNDLLRAGFSEEDFFMIQGEDMTTAHKPNPDVFTPILDVLREYDVTPAEVLYVGDSLIDANAARDAGLQFCGVTTGLTTEEAFTRAGYDEVLESVAFLPSLLTIRSFA